MGERDTVKRGRNSIRKFPEATKGHSHSRCNSSKGKITGRRIDTEREISRTRRDRLIFIRIFRNSEKNRGVPIIFREICRWNSPVPYRACCDTKSRTLFWRRKREKREKKEEKKKKNGRLTLRDAISPPSCYFDVPVRRNPPLCSNKDLGKVIISE